MYCTKEIRWFFAEENKAIRSWFDKLEFEAVEVREDKYLELETENVGVKLREGKTEIKQRIGLRSKGCLSPKAWGIFEKWIKWSFDTKDDDPLYGQIIKDENEHWISVRKKRYGTILTEKNGEILTCPPSQIGGFGCQIEYVKLSIRGEVWYSFGLEWFGETCIDLTPSQITEIVGNTELRMRRSSGYPEFLKSKF